MLIYCVHTKILRKRMHFLLEDKTKAAAPNKVGLAAVQHYLEIDVYQDQSSPEPS